jgi:hypothetical protein
MPANIREILIGFGKKKQADIETANLLAGIWRLGKLNASFGGPKLNTENDAPELGKGHEFATAVYKTAWDVAGQLEKYLTSQFAAWVMAFSLGKVVKTGEVSPFTYTCTPLDPVEDGLELPCFSYIEQIRPGANVVLDRMAVGCALEGWTLTIGSGPGRANSKLVADFVGSGKHVEPSLIVLPLATPEKLLPSAGLTCTINGEDYVTKKNFVSLEASWKNNIRLDSGYFPGSGFQTPGDATSGAIRGRLEVGDREAGLKFTARYDKDSSELTKLLALTEGTAVITLTHNAENSLTLTFHRVIFSVAELGEADGLVTVEVTCAPLWHAVNKLLTVEALCDVDDIAQ